MEIPKIAVTQNGMAIPLIVSPKNSKFIPDTAAHKYPPARAPTAVPELKNVCCSPNIVPLTSDGVRSACKTRINGIPIPKERVASEYKPINIHKFLTNGMRKKTGLEMKYPAIIRCFLFPILSLK